MADLVLDLISKHIFNVFKCYLFLNFKLILTRYLNNYYSNEGTFILFEHLGTLLLYYCKSSQFYSLEISLK